MMATVKKTNQSYRPWCTERNPTLFSLSDQIWKTLLKTGYLIGTDSIDKGQWQPNYDFYEADDDILLTVDLAGFKKRNAYY